MEPITVKYKVLDSRAKVPAYATSGSAAADLCAVLDEPLTVQPMQRVLGIYGEWLRSIQPQGEKAVLAGMMRRILLQVGINLSLVIAIFLGGAYFAGGLAGWLSTWITDPDLQKACILGGALLLSLPCLIAAYRKLKALAMLMAELSVRQNQAGRYTQPVRRLVSELIPLLSLAGILVLLAALSSSILPRGELLLLIGLVAVVVIAVLWRWFIRVHSRLQIAFIETLEQDKGGHP